MAGINIHKVSDRMATERLDVVPIMKNGVRKPLLNLSGKTIEDLTHGEQSKYTEVFPDGKKIEWVLPHSKDFQQFINDHFRDFISSGRDFVASIENLKSSKDPFPYQKFIYEYLRYGTPYRGLLLEHGLGSGKTRSAILVAESFRKVGLPTLILTPAFLSTNFRQEIKKWCPEITDAELETYYKFVSYNATGTSHGENAGKGSVFEQLARIGIGFPESDPLNSFTYIKKNYSGLTPPKNMLIVIEEMHGLNRSFGNVTGKIRKLLYSLLMRAEDCKILGLSATPMILPVELATIYNLLRGPVAGGRMLLPENEEDFDEIFLDYERNTVKHETTFMRRIIGLESYFSGISDTASGKVYPRKDENIIMSSMSKFQTKTHETAKAEEEGKIKRREKKRTTTDMEKEKINPPSSFLVRSRKACNFALPEELFNIREFSFKNPGDARPVSEATMDKIADILGNTEDIPAAIRAMKTPMTKKHELWSYMTDDDKFNYGLITDTLSSEDVLAALERFNSTHGCFNLGAPEGEPTGLRKYSIKMYTIYKMLIEGIDMGAPHVIKGPRKSEDRVEIPKEAAAAAAAASADIIGEEDDIPSEGEEGEGEEETSQRGGGDGDDGQDGDDDTESTESGSAKSTDGDQDGGGDKQEKPKKRPLVRRSRIPVEAEERRPASYDIHDPFMNKDIEAGERLRDVFLSDKELDKKYGADNWTIKGGPALIYSFFASMEGCGIFSKILESHGFEKFVPTKGMTVARMTRKPRYAVIRGGMSNFQKTQLLEIFNHPENRHGQLIRTVFVTQAAAEGISLFQLRQIHIMEPFWDDVLIRQVTGRGFRLRSHQFLPEDECVIHVRHHIAKGAKGETTADILIKDIAKRKDIYQDAFKSLRMRGAVDCLINSNHHKLDNCFKLASTNQFSYNADIRDDLRDKGKVISVEKKVDRVNITINGQNATIDKSKKIRIYRTTDAKKRTVEAYRVYIQDTLYGYATVDNKPDGSGPKFYKLDNPPTIAEI